MLTLCISSSGSSTGSDSSRLTGVAKGCADLRGLKSMAGDQPPTGTAFSSDLTRTAVHIQIYSGDIRSLVAGQEKYGMTHFLWRPEPLHGNPGLNPGGKRVLRRLRHFRPSKNRSFNRTRTDNVHANATIHQFGREGAGK